VKVRLVKHEFWESEPFCVPSLAAIQRLELTSDCKTERVEVPEKNASYDRITEFKWRVYFLEEVN
jgi:hypothetical protein